MAPNLLKIERRAWLRLPNEQDIVCRPVTNEPQTEPELAWMGKGRDISPAGIGLSMNRRFEPGSELVAELSVKPDASVLLPVHVIHATPDKNGSWIIGCRFIFQLTEEEQETLFGARVSRTATENPPGPAQPASPDR